MRIRNGFFGVGTHLGLVMEGQVGMMNDVSHGAADVTN